MKNLIVCLIFFVAATTAMAQTKSNKISEAEFRKAKQEYLTRELDLNDKESKAFFPLYEEFQRKKKEIYDENQQLMERADIAGEEEYRKIINRLLDLQIMSDELEKKYYDKFAQVLTYKKLFKLNKAESAFQKHMLKEISKRNSRQK